MKRKEEEEVILRKEEEIRTKETEVMRTRQELEARKVVQEARKIELEARKKEQEANKMEQQERKKEREANLKKEIEAKRREEEMQRREEESRRREQEAKEKEQDQVTIPQRVHVPKPEQQKIMEETQKKSSGLITSRGLDELRSVESSHVEEDQPVYRNAITSGTVGPSITETIQGGADTEAGMVERDASRTEPADQAWTIAPDRGMQGPPSRNESRSTVPDRQHDASSSYSIPSSSGGGPRSDVMGRPSPNTSNGEAAVLSLQDGDQGAQLAPISKANEHLLKLLFPDEYPAQYERQRGEDGVMAPQVAWKGDQATKSVEDTKRREEVKEEDILRKGEEIRTKEREVMRTRKEPEMEQEARKSELEVKKTEEARKGELEERKKAQGPYLKKEIETTEEALQEREGETRRKEQEIKEKEQDQATDLHVLKPEQQETMDRIKEAQKERSSLVASRGMDELLAVESSHIDEDPPASRKAITSGTVRPSITETTRGGAHTEADTRVSVSLLHGGTIGLVLPILQPAPQPPTLIHHTLSLPVPVTVPCAPTAEERKREQEEGKKELEAKRREEEIRRKEQQAKEKEDQVTMSQWVHVSKPEQLEESMDRIKETQKASSSLVTSRGPDELRPLESSHVDEDQTVSRNAITSGTVGPSIPETIRGGADIEANIQVSVSPSHRGTDLPFSRPTSQSPTSIHHTVSLPVLSTTPRVPTASSNKPRPLYLSESYDATTDAGSGTATSSSEGSDRTRRSASDPTSPKRQHKDSSRTGRGYKILGIYTLNKTLRGGGGGKVKPPTHNVAGEKGFWDPGQAPYSRIEEETKEKEEELRKRETAVKKHEEEVKKQEEEVKRREEEVKKRQEMRKYEDRLRKRAEEAQQMKLEAKQENQALDVNMVCVRVFILVQARKSFMRFCVSAGTPSTGDGGSFARRSSGFYGPTSCSSDILI